MQSLTPPAQKIIEDYLALPLPGGPIATPYYNNKRKGVRMGLRALVGKGTPEEISSEAMIYAQREKVDFTNISAEDKKRFLVDHNLGIDCSGLAFHLLNAESLARDKGSLASHLQYPFRNTPIARILRIIRRRYVENTDTLTLADHNNSHEINVGDIAPGDLVVLIDRGSGERNHILIVSDVYDGKVNLIHSIAYPEDGKYSHGVRAETFTISDQLKDEIRERFRAKSLWLRRLNWL